MSVTYTQAQIDALTEAIASGALEVRHGDKVVKYRSLHDMKVQLDRMCSALNNTARPAARFGTFNRGD